MTGEWLAKNTTRNQDHVIAHVIGATPLGYFMLDEALHLLLDMGFVWTIYVDGEMALLPQTVAIGELEVEAEMNQQLRAEIDLLHAYGRDAPGLTRILPAPLDCTIKDVSLLTKQDARRLLLQGEEGSLAIETSLRTAEIRVYEIMNG